MWLANQLTNSNYSLLKDQDLVNKIEAEQKRDIEGYYIDLQPTTRSSNAWLRYRDGNNYVYQILSRTPNEVILFTRGILY